MSKLTATVYSRCDYCRESLEPCPSDLDVPEGWESYTINFPNSPWPWNIALCPNCKGHTREEAILAVFDQLRVRSAENERRLLLLEKHVAKMLFPTESKYSALGRVMRFVDDLVKQDDEAGKEQL